MILVDLNQTMISNLMVSLGNHKNAEIDEAMLRHMVLNSIRSYRKKFHLDYGELVICCDDKNYWRRDKFPYYKAMRKKSREESEIDWDSVFSALENIRNELKEYFPYRVIQIPKAEADDIIATLVDMREDFSPDESILIMSGDKDYIQLHNRDYVKQYDPTRKVWVSHANPEEYLHEHVLKGDRGDGVPNVLSEDNSLVLGIRQKPITKKRIEEYKDLSNITDEALEKYQRNKTLIDLSEVPQEIRDQVVESYKEQDGKNRSKVLKYFMDHRLKHLMKDIGDF